MLVYRDGRRQPVDSIYIGQRRGIHRWQILVDPQQAAELESVECDILPSKTSIQLELAEDR